MCLFFLICLSIKPTSLVQNDIYPVCHILPHSLSMLTWISCGRVLKFDFLLLICYVSFELFEQTEELKEKGESSLPHPQILKHREINWLLLPADQQSQQTQEKGENKAIFWLYSSCSGGCEIGKIWMDSVLTLFVGLSSMSRETKEVRVLREKGTEKKTSRREDCGLGRERGRIHGLPSKSRPPCVVQKKGSKTPHCALDSFSFKLVALAQEPLVTFGNASGCHH